MLTFPFSWETSKPLVLRFETADSRYEDIYSFKLGAYVAWKSDVIPKDYNFEVKLIGCAAQKVTKVNDYGNFQYYLSETYTDNLKSYF